MPRTIAVIAVVVCLGLAGCSLVGSPEGEPFPSTDQSCLTVTVPRPAELKAVGAVTPVAYPDPPPTANSTAIEKFVIGFERAYYTNTLLETRRDDDHPGIDRVILGYHDRSVRNRSNGFLVEFTVSGSVYYSDGTIGDIEEVQVAYFLNETVLRRYDEGLLANTAGEPGARNGTVLVRC